MPKTPSNSSFGQGHVVNGGMAETDVVAVVGDPSVEWRFDAGERPPTFREQASSSGFRTFTLEDREEKREDNSSVKVIGTEVKPSDGFEYLVAVVSSKSGRIRELHPTTLVDFQVMCNPPEGLARGEKRKRQATDYNKNFDAVNDKEDPMAKRRRTIEDFGGAKVIKSLASAARRRVTEDTLNTMSATAFSSSTSRNAEGGNKKLKNGELDAEGTPNVPLLHKAESSVLPQPNIKATTPSEIYAIEQFLPQPASTSAFLGTAADLESEATEFFEKHNSSLKLFEKAGVPKVVANRIGNVSKRIQEPDQRGYLLVAMKLVALAKIVAELFTGRRSVTIPLQRLDALAIPPQIRDSIQGEFFGESKKVSGSLRYQLSAQQTSRVYAHLLCMLLIIADPDFTLPISPLVSELKIQERPMVKLLQGMGCTVTTAVDSVGMNTARIAKLSGLPEKTTLRQFMFARK